MPWTYIDNVLIDANISENPTFSNTVTDKPVEEGGSISDHVENEPTILPLECVITGQEGMGAEDKYERILEITQKKEIIEVVGALQVYENMVIEEFTPNKDSEIENGFRADITLKQIRIVEQDTIRIDLGLDPETGAQAQGEDTEIEGRDPNKEDVDEDTISSLGYNIVGPYLFENEEGEE